MWTYCPGCCRLNNKNSEAYNAPQELPKAFPQAMAPPRTGSQSTISRPNSHIWNCWMAEKRRNYDRQFKVDAVALLESSGRQVQEIEAELGIGQGCLSRWRKELAEQGSPVEQAEKRRRRSACGS